MESACRTAHTIDTFRRFVEHVVGGIDDGVNLHIVLFEVFLRQFEKAALGLLHQFVDIGSGVEGLVLDVCRIGNELPCRGFLGDDAGMVLHVVAARHLVAQLHKVGHSARRLQGLALLQFLGDGVEVGRTLFDVQLPDGLINQLVAAVVEAFGLQDFTDFGIGFPFE